MNETESVWEKKKKMKKERKIQSRKTLNKVYNYHTK